MSPVRFRRFAVVAAALLLFSVAAVAQLDADQEVYVADVVAFTSAPREQVLQRIMHGRELIAEEWLAWEKQGRMTDERVKAFYKQTANYIYDLGHWHLWQHDKRASDARLVDDMKALGRRASSILAAALGSMR